MEGKGGRGGWRKGRAGENCSSGHTSGERGRKSWPGSVNQGLRFESTAQTATMGGKNKQRTKGNLRVSGRWPSRPESLPRSGLPGSTRRQQMFAARLREGVCLRVECDLSLVHASPRQGGLSLSRLGSCKRKDVPCQSRPHLSNLPFPPHRFFIRKWFSLSFNCKVTWPGYRWWN